jgi:hypothetical protein
MGVTKKILAAIFATKERRQQGFSQAQASPQKEEKPLKI